MLWHYPTFLKVNVTFALSKRMGRWLPWKPVSHSRLFPASLAFQIFALSTPSVFWNGHSFLDFTSHSELFFFFFSFNYYWEYCLVHFISARKKLLSKVISHVEVKFLAICLRGGFQVLVVHRQHSEHPHILLHWTEISLFIGYSQQSAWVFLPSLNLIQVETYSHNYEHVMWMKPACYCCCLA